MGSAKKTVINTYIRLPKSIRKYTDPLVKNRAKTKQSLEQRAQKGKQIIKNRLKKAIIGKRKRRR